MSMRTLNHLIRWRNRLMCYIGSELWESKFDGLLSLVKEYIICIIYRCVGNTKT